MLAEVQPALVPLLRRCPGIDQLLPGGAPLPEFDVQAPLLSLPGLFHTTLETVPADVPYLSADPQRIERWGAELAAVSGFKVGIAWQGSSKYAGDKHRSLPLKHFEPLARLPGVRLLSLQKGPGREQLAAVAAEWNVLDWTERLDESGGAFMDTAALMQHLDLVVTSDTAIAHLAGASACRSGSSCPLRGTGVGCWTARTVPGIRPCVCSAKDAGATGTRSSFASPQRFASARPMRPCVSRW